MYFALMGSKCLFRSIVLKKKIALILVLVMVLSIIPNERYQTLKDVKNISNVQAAGQVTGAAVVDMARNYIGHMTYISGGMDLSVGVDCSGFVCAIYRLLGVDLVSQGVRSTWDMLGSPEKIHAVNIGSTNKADIRNGDLVITNNGGHVGIGTDSGHMIHQTNSAINEVREVDLDDYSSAIVAIIRIDYTKWGGVNATNLNTPIDQNASNNNNNNANNNATKVEDKDNPGYPYAVPGVDVSFGSKSSDTMWLQTALNKIDNAGLTVDGSFGRLSEIAVKNFQTKFGITASGVCDATTRNKIVDVHKAINGITKVEIVGEKLTGNEGEFISLSTKVTPEVSVSVPMTWISTNGDVAIVENGNVALLNEGQVGIVAKAPNGVTGSVSITVTGKSHYNEWHNGRWYGADGKSTYEYTGEWKHDNTGYWFEDTSGWYPKNEWVKIEGDWYYFGSNGYNARNSWKQVGSTWYYFKKDGKMAESEWVGGYWLSAGGAWTYSGVAKWKQDGTGWWYEDSLGWYPKGETVKIDDKEYTFNTGGYWVSQ